MPLHGRHVRVPHAHLYTEQRGLDGRAHTGTAVLRVHLICNRCQGIPPSIVAAVTTTHLATPLDCGVRYARWGAAGLPAHPVHCCTTANSSGDGGAGYSVASED